eukprot:6184588-Pleurochrysis_carterae.AAC.4
MARSTSRKFCPCCESNARARSHCERVVRTIPHDEVKSTAPAGENGASSKVHSVSDPGDVYEGATASLSGLSAGNRKLCCSLVSRTSASRDNEDQRACVRGQARAPRKRTARGTSCTTLPSSEATAPLSSALKPFFSRVRLSSSTRGGARLPRGSPRRPRR